MAPLGFLFAPFGFLLAPFWQPSAHFCSLEMSSRTTLLLQAAFRFVLDSSWCILGAFWSQLVFKWQPKCSQSHSSGTKRIQKSYPCLVRFLGAFCYISCLSSGVTESIIDFRPHVCVWASVISIKFGPMLVQISSSFAYINEVYLSTSPRFHYTYVAIY